MPPVIPYTKQTWVDGSGGATPISAARLGVLEEGVLDVSRQPAVRVYNSAAQSIPNTTVAVIAFNSEVYDQAAGAAATHHDIATNTSRLTCLYAGLYLITGQIRWAGAAGGTVREVFIQHSALGRIVDINIPPNGANAVDNNPTTIAAMNVNDYVEMYAYQDSGAALNTQVGANYSPHFMMVRVG